MEKSKGNVVKHPSSAKLVSDVWARFMRLQKQHQAAMNTAWLGTLALNFTDDELRAIARNMCPHDFALLKKAGREIEMPANVRKIING